MTPLGVACPATMLEYGSFKLDLLKKYNNNNNNNIIEKEKEINHDSCLAPLTNPISKPSQNLKVAGNNRSRTM